MKRAKRYLWTVIMLIVYISAYAYDAEINGIYYNLIDKGRIAEVTSNPDKYSGNVVIPSYVDYGGYRYVVTSIGSSSFSGCSGLKSVSISNSVNYIGDDAFNGCLGLTSVVIPNSVTSIEEGTFSYCSGLTSVIIPNSVTSIGRAAFKGCF